MSAYNFKIEAVLGKAEAVIKIENYRVLESSAGGGQGEISNRQ